MILLGVDTCGGTGTLALARVDRGAITAPAEVELAGRTAAAMLVPALSEMLDIAGLSLGAVSGMVVVDGPGSFTGIRIGLSAAKGLAEGLGLPVFAVSRLQVLAAAGTAGSAVLDAGRGEFYFLDRAGRESLLTAEDLAVRADESESPVACEAKVAGALPGARLVAAPTALDAIRVALPEVLLGRAGDVALLDGRYLRRADLYRVSPGPSAAQASSVPEP